MIEFFRNYWHLVLFSFSKDPQKTQDLFSLQKTYLTGIAETLAEINASGDTKKIKEASEIIRRLRKFPRLPHPSRLAENTTQLSAILLDLDVILLKL